MSIENDVTKAIAKRKMELDVALDALDRRAMLLDRDAVLRLTSLYRQTRTAIDALLSSRYADGACDGVAVGQFICDLRAATDYLIDDEDGS